MLATTGTAKLTAADEQHPDYITASDILDDILEELQSRALWFNTSTRVLKQSVDGKVVVPSSALSCDPVDASQEFAIRGQYLYDVGNNTFLINCDVTCRIVSELALEDMPPIAVQFVRAAARFQYFIDQDGDAQKLSVYGEIFRSKEMDLVATNMKHQDVNFFAGSSYMNFSTRRDASSNPITRIQ
jgi:hypothetical protein